MENLLAFGTMFDWGIFPFWLPSRLHYLSSHYNAPIARLFLTTVDEVWNFHFFCNRDDHEAIYLASILFYLICVLYSLCLTSFFGLLIHLGISLVNLFFPFILSAPIQRKNFLWVIIRGRQKLLVKLKLLSGLWSLICSILNILQRSNCYKSLSIDIYVMCMQASEDSSHLFLHCIEEWKLWCSLYEIFGEMLRCYGVAVALLLSGVFRREECSDF